MNIPYYSIRWGTFTWTHKRMELVASTPCAENRRLSTCRWTTTIAVIVSIWVKTLVPGSYPKMVGWLSVIPLKYGHNRLWPIVISLALMVLGLNALASWVALATTAVNRWKTLPGRWGVLDSTELVHWTWEPWAWEQWANYGRGRSPLRKIKYSI